MTTAEQIAAEGPYRADWENGMSVVRDLNAPDGNKIMMMMPENMKWFAERMNEAHAEGYARGQQDRWIAVSKPPNVAITCPCLRDDGWWIKASYLPDDQVWLSNGEIVKPTHYLLLPSPPNPE